MVVLTRFIRGLCFGRGQDEGEELSRSESNDNYGRHGFDIHAGDWPTGRPLPAVTR